DSGASVSDNISFTWFVRKLVLRRIEDMENLTGDTVDFTSVAPYSGAGTLTYSATGLPSGITIDTNTGEISGTVASNADATNPYSVTVSVTDGTLSASKAYSWNVKKLFLADPYSQFGMDAQTINLPLFVKKLSTHTVTFSASGLPSGLSINANTGVISG